MNPACARPQDPRGTSSTDAGADIEAPGGSTGESHDVGHAISPGSLHHRHVHPGRGLVSSEESSTDFHIRSGGAPLLAPATASLSEPRTLKTTTRWRRPWVLATAATLHAPLAAAWVIPTSLAIALRSLPKRRPCASPLLLYAAAVAAVGFVLLGGFIPRPRLCSQQSLPLDVQPDAGVLSRTPAREHFHAIAHNSDGDVAPGVGGSLQSDGSSSLGSEAAMVAYDDEGWLVPLREALGLNAPSRIDDGASRRGMGRRRVRRDRDVWPLLLSVLDGIRLHGSFRGSESDGCSFIRVHADR